MRILIATFPFGKCGRKPLSLLEETGWEIIQNPYNRRLSPDEIGEIIRGVDAIIAGTEPYNHDILKNNPKLRGISRVGVGLDNVDLDYCKNQGISVTYTPDAPSQGVAELTVCNIINLLRYILISDRSVKHNCWYRYIGSLLEEVKIGVVGVGRIGKKVIKLLKPFRPEIIGCDLKRDKKFSDENKFEWVEKEELFRNSDLVTLHIPYNEFNHHYVDRVTIAKMKRGSFLINTSRGGILDETALIDALIEKHLAGAALDVFENEPYNGNLIKFDNVILTAHIGASANRSRYLMELGAAEDCIRVLKGQKPKHNAILDVENELEIYKKLGK